MKQSLFLKRSLMDGEEVLYSANVHFMFVIKAALIALMLFAMGYGISFLFKMSGLLPMPYTDIPMHLLGGLGILFFVWRFLWMLTVEIVFTNKRFLLKRGVIFIQQSKINLSGIDSCEIRNTLLGTWLDYGDILVSTIASADGNPRLPCISRPGEFTKTFDGQKDNRYKISPVIGVPVE